MVADTRLIGQTAENIFLALVNQGGVHATVFDSEGFDGIIFDINKTLFTKGESPFFTQIKCRGSSSEKFNNQGHSVAAIEKMFKVAEKLNISKSSLYFTAGFFNNDDIRSIIFYSLPLTEIHHFQTKKGNYRFAVDSCEKALGTVPGIFKL